MGNTPTPIHKRNGKLIGMEWLEDHNKDGFPISHKKKCSSRYWSFVERLWSLLGLEIAGWTKKKWIDCHPYRAYRIFTLRGAASLQGWDVIAAAFCRKGLLASDLGWGWVSASPTFFASCPFSINELDGSGWFSGSGSTHLFRTLCLESTVHCERFWTWIPLLRIETYMADCLLGHGLSRR